MAKYCNPVTSELFSFGRFELSGFGCDFCSSIAACESISSRIVQRPGIGPRQQLLNLSLRKSRDV